MTNPPERKDRNSTSSDKIIVALDVESTDSAREIIAELDGLVNTFKIGLQLFTSAGGGFVEELVENGTRIFLDLKFHDIPNTVAKAGVEAARLGVWMFNVHAAGGSEMMKRTAGEVREVCEKDNLAVPRIIGVTVLTSSDNETLREAGFFGGIEKRVLELAKLAAESELNGVVAAGSEIELIRDSIDDPDFLIVTPGIRPEFATNHDQRRVMTPVDAIRRGSSHLVIGRPIIEAADRRSAAERILADLDAAHHSLDRTFVP